MDENTAAGHDSETRRPVFDPRTGEQIVSPARDSSGPPVRPEPEGPRPLWKLWIGALAVGFWIVWFVAEQPLGDSRALLVVGFVAFVCGIVGDAVIESKRSFLVVPGCLFGPVLLPLALVAFILLIYFVSTGASDFTAALALLLLIGAGLLIMLPAMLGAFLGALLRTLFPPERPRDERPPPVF